MDAGDIVLCAQEEMNIGKGKVRIGEEIQEVIPKNTILHNAEVFEVREREASGKMGVGSVIAGIGAGIAMVGLLCLVGAATVVSGGTALLAVGAGTTAFLFGNAKAQEGV